MDNIPKKIESRLRQHFSYILDSSHAQFQPVYLQATYLNPLLYRALNDTQITMTRTSLIPQLYKRTYLSNDINMPLEDQEVYADEKKEELITCTVTSYADQHRLNVISLIFRIRICKFSS